MPEKKKQHYVPKFYLRFFGNHEKDTHIGLYNIPSRKFITEAAISSQAYENFFYGKDSEIENALGTIEDQAAKVLKEVIEKKEIPKYKSEEYTTLWLFILLQGTRTRNAAKETNDMLDLTIKHLFKDHPSLDGIDMSNYRIELEDPVLLNLQTSLKSFVVAQDLKCKLIINESKLPFITSDHPVVRYNQFLEKRMYPDGKIGLASKGLQIFCPISPRLSIILYDARVYKIGYKKQSAITTVKEINIHQLNLLQVLNCGENIYFNDKMSEYQINNLIEKSEKYIGGIEPRVNEYFGETKKDGSSSSIVKTSGPHIEIKLNLSFIKETDHSKQYKFSSYAIQLRDEKYRNINID
jgi:hypothetical protein